MKRKTIDIVTLGCSKNLVDSERLMFRLKECGYEVTHDSASPEGEIVVISPSIRFLSSARPKKKDWWRRCS